MLEGLSSPSTSFGGFVSAMPTSDTKLIRDKTEQDVVWFMRHLIVNLYTRIRIGYLVSGIWYIGFQ